MTGPELKAMFIREAALAIAASGQFTEYSDPQLIWIRAKVLWDSMPREYKNMYELAADE